MPFHTEFVPDDDMRRMVESMAGYGIPQPEIARVVVPGGIDEKTLRKHFAEELEVGRIKANANVAGALYKSAMGYPDQHGKPTRDPNVIAQIFWMKVRARWRGDSEPEPLTIEAPVEYIDLTDAERASRIAALLERGRSARDRSTHNGGSAVATLPRPTNGSTEH